MGAPSHLSVLHQVRHNVLALLMEKSADPAYRQQLQEFLALEPIALNSDVYHQLATSNTTSLGLVRLESPIILTDNPRPKLVGWRIADCKNYLRQWARFLVLKVLIRYLPRVLGFEAQIKPVTIINHDVAAKKP